MYAGSSLRGYPSHCVGPAADGYTVPKAPAGYALINVIDIVSRNMKIISMDLLIVPQVMDLYIWQFLVPNKRFKSHKLRKFDGFVPRKRFTRYQMPSIDVFVPQKRFNRDKRALFPDFDSQKIPFFLRSDNQYIVKSADFSG